LFPNQVDTAQKIAETFKRNDQRVFLFAEPQAGKTGVVGKVVLDFIERCQSQGKTWQIAYFVCISDNELLEQTEERFQDDFGLASYIESSQIVFAHASNIDDRFERIQKPSAVQETLFILDEGHLNKSRRKVAGVSDLVLSKVVDFLRENEIDITRPCREWGSSENHVAYLLEVSATPYGEDVASLDNRLYQEIFHAPGEDYVGVRQIDAAGRFVEGGALLDSTGIDETQWELIQAEYAKDVARKGKGHCIIRVSDNNKAKTLRDFIKSTQPEARIKIFYSQKVDDPTFESIARFQRNLSSSGWVQSHSYLIIIQGFRAGKTLDDTQNIRCWVETSSGQNDAMMQSVGRNFGYGKGSETHTIICDTSEIKKYIEYVEAKERGDIPLIPSGTANKGASVKVGNGIWEYVPLTKEEFDAWKNDPDFWKKVLERSGLSEGEKAEFLKLYGATKPTLGWNSKIGSKTPQRACDTMSSYVLYGDFRAYSKSGNSIKCPYLDAPAPAHAVIEGRDESWDDIQADKRFAHWLGKVLVPVWGETSKMTQSALKNTSVYSSGAPLSSRSRRTNFTFSLVGIKPGSRLVPTINPEKWEVLVVDDKRVRLREVGGWDRGVVALSVAANIIQGRPPKSPTRGTAFFTFQGKPLTELYEKAL